MLVVPTQQLRRASLALPGLGRQRFSARFQNRHRGLHADYILEAEFGDTGAKSTIPSVGAISEHNPTSHPCFHCLPNLIQSNLGFGPELNLFGYPGCFPALEILGPLLRQIEAVRNRKTRIPSSDRQTHRHLAVVLLT